MSSKVVLQAVDSRTFKLALRDVRFAKFNEKLTGPEPENWRFMHTPEPEETTSEYKSVLESPVEFTMVEGEVKEIKSSKEEATWTINFKKSLISLIKIQSPSGRIDISQNNVRTETGRLPEIWSVMEEGVDGECENTYQFIEVPTYMLSELTHGKMGMETCEKRGLKAYQITKTRNLNKCAKRTSWASIAPGELECEIGNCDLMFERSSMTRYLGCGSSAEDVELKVILNQGELLQNLMGYNTENVVTGTEQTLEIVEKRSTLSSLPEISSPRTSESLFSEYPSSFYKYTGETPEVSLIRQRSASPSPRESFLKKLSPSTLKQKMVEKISQIVRDLKEVEDFEKKQVSAHVLTLSKSLFLLDEEELKSVFEELKGLKLDEEDRETARQLFLEIALTSGSNSSIRFLKKMIESGELSSLRIGEIIATLPHYIKTPSVEIMTDIFEVVKSPAVTRHSLLKYNANLAFANLVNKVCISSTRLVRFPIFVFGEFCSHEKLTGEYVPHLVEELKSAETPAERTSAILALGELGHESVIPTLLPYIEGKSDKSTPVEQRMAIYSLNSVTIKHRHILYPIYSALVFNPTEPREVRIAALSEMLRMQPSMVEFQKLATSTWFEEDAEFLKFVVSTLKSLSNIEPSELPKIGMLYELSIKARAVYPLSKPVPGIISSTLNAFTSEWLKELEVGYNMHGSYSFTGKKMDVYGKLEYFLQALRFSPVEFAISAQGPRSMVEKVTELLGGEIRSLERLHPEWRSIISSIELTAREELPFHAGSWVKVLNDIQVVTGLDSTMLERLVKSGKQYISEPSEWKKYICGKKNINLVKVTNIASSEIMVPSEMGLHIGVVSGMPSVLSLRGEVEIDCSVSKPSLTLDLTKKLSTSSVGVVGVLDPISEEVLAVGVNQEWSVNYPSKITAEVEEGKLKVKYTPNSEVSPNTREIDLVTYSVKPFAVSKPHPYSDLTPLTAHENTKLIRSSGERKSEVYHFGETLGLGMKFELKTETEINDMKSVLEMMSLYNYSPLNTVIFGMTNSAVTLSGRPSCRYHEVKMVYSPEESSTKKLELGLTVVRQLKNQPLKKIVVQKVPSGLQIASQHLQASSQSQKLQQKVSQLSVEEGYGFTANVDLKLDGGERKTYNWEMTAFHGFSGVEQKWNLHLEDKERLNICIEGEVSLPLIPLKDVRTLKSENMRFSYKNTIGFGKTCEDHEIKVVGATYRSEEQKERSEVGRSGRKCEETTRKVEELREEVRSTKEGSSERRKLENELERMVEEKEEYCTRYIEELSTLDKVKFRIESTPMPSYVRKYTRVLDSAVKTVLLPYMSRIEGGNNKEREVEVELRFNSELNTLNMALTTEHETIDYHNIRLPEELRGIVPLRSTVRPHEQIIKSVAGSSVYEKCSIGDGVVKTFDNKTYSYELDDCYHVLSSDCSKSHSHAILGKVVDGKEEIEIFVEGSKVTMKPSSSWTESRREYEVTVDGKVVRVEENEKKEVTSRNGKISYRIHRSADDVMILETPINRVTYDGKTVELEHARNSAHQCGLCGNLDSIKANDIKTAKSCVAQSLKQAALTYRVQKSCSPLSVEQQKIVSQQVACAEKVKKISYTPIVASLLEKCQVTKHSMIRQAGKLCISQVPIVECGSGCASRSTIARSVPFTCLPSNRERVSKLYAEKVVRGGILPELRNMEKTFAAQMQVPVSCAHPSL